MKGAGGEREGGGGEGRGGEGRGGEGGREGGERQTNTQDFLVQCLIIMLWNNSPIL